MNGERLRVALVGCGRMGATIDDEVVGRPDFVPPYSHAASIRAAAELELVAVADVDAAKVAAAQARYGVAAGYTDYREMIRAERPDIVSIATRPATHREIVEYAAAAGVRGIYCEKPLCCSMAEADAIRAACEQAGVKFNLGTNRRYQLLYHQIRERIRAGELGEVRAIVGHCGGGGALWSLTHASDLLLFLAGDGEVEWAQGHARIPPETIAGNRIAADPPVPIGSFRFASGAFGVLLPSPNFEIEVCGSEGWIRTWNNGVACDFRRRETRWGHYGPAEPVAAPVTSGTLGGLRDLARALLTDGDTLSSVTIACRGLEMMLALVESERRGGARVPLPLADRDLYVGKPDW